MGTYEAIGEVVSACCDSLTIDRGDGSSVLNAAYHGEEVKDQDWILGLLGSQVKVKVIDGEVKELEILPQA